MLQTKTDRGTAPLESQEADALRRWIAADGEAVVVEEAGLSHLTIARGAALLPIHAGSRAAVRAALSRRRAT